MSTATAMAASSFVEVSEAVSEEGGARLSLTMMAMWKTPMTRTTMTSPFQLYCSLQ